VHLTQGTFSHLPPLSDEEIVAQVQYCLDNGWSVSLEHTGDPHPRNVYWEMWGPPQYDLRSPAAFLAELDACRRAHPDEYVRVSAFDRRRGRQTTALSFIVNRPAVEPGLRLERLESRDRQVRYGLRPSESDGPAGRRHR
jgi:ribulose-bisphosphate carboxylase small chain